MAVKDRDRPRYRHSYNPAQIDVDKVRRIDRPGVYTVGALLSKVLDGYKVRTAFVPPRKLLIQAEKIENVCLGGTVLEEESGERLYGAVVSIDTAWAGARLPLPTPTAFTAFTFRLALICSMFLIWDMPLRAAA